MSSSDRKFQYIPRYKHFVKAPFIKRHRASSATLCYVLCGFDLRLRLAWCYRQFGLI
nr:MAG TPA: hypothetical protein [Caudoviricetes sp.]